MSNLTLEVVEMLGHTIAKVVPITMPEAPVRAKADRPSTWPSLLIGFVLGTAFGAGIVWWLLNR